MSKPYNQYKVNELKVILQERGLPTSGTKSELIGRLTESDSTSTPQEADAPVEAEKQAEEEKPEVEKPEEEPEEPSAEAETSESKTDAPVSKEGEEEDEIALPPAEPEKPQPTEEELFKSFSDDLKTRIQRTERFGGDATELKARLKRLEKFGVSTILDANAKASKAPTAKISGGEKKRGNRKNRNNNKNRPKPAVA